MPRKRQYKEDQVLQALRLKEQGYSLVEIEKITHINRDNIRNITNFNGGYLDIVNKFLEQGGTIKDSRAYTRQPKGQTKKEYQRQWRENKRRENFALKFKNSK